MGSIRYRNCSIEGTRAAAVLSFRESVADVVNQVNTELAKLNDLTANRRNEQVVLNGTADSVLTKEPFNGSLVVRSLPDSQGYTYRKAPLIEKEYSTVVVDGSTIKQGKGGLKETYEASLGQWVFQNIDGTASASTDALSDSTYFSKNPTLDSGTAPSTATQEGPLGYARTFNGSTFFRLPTKMALGKISLSQMLIHDDLSAWAWIKTGAANERVVFSFSSEPEPPPLVGTATLPGSVFVGSDGRSRSNITVTSTAGLTKFCRIIFGVQPDRVYEVENIVGLVITLTEVYSGPAAVGASMHLAFSMDPGNEVYYHPETRNTLYGLSVERGASKVRFYWERNQRQVVECTNTNVSWTDAEYIFIGVQRRNRRLGTITRSGGVNISGAGFASTFGLGSGTGKFIRFVGDGVTIDDRYYEIDTVIDDNNLTLVSDAFTSNLADYTGEITSLRCMIHVGKLDGTFNTQTIDHLPGPTGGVAARDINSKNIEADYFVGHDAEFPAKNFVGSMNALSMYSVAIDDTDDSKIKRMFSRAFPDYIATGQQIHRSVVSDIADGQTVFCDYTYKTSLALTRQTTDLSNIKMDDMLVGLNNPTVKTTSQLAQTIGTPDPNLQDNIEHLNRLMTKYGMLVANGQPIIRGTTDMSAYNALAQTVGSVEAADSLVLNKPYKSFVLVAITEDSQAIDTVDSCGRPSKTILITERIVGVNKNLREAALAAGYANTDPLKLKIWWIGAVGIEDNSIQKMRNIGMTGSQIADALSVTSTDRMKVYVIPVPELAQKLRDAGLAEEDINEIATRPEDTTAGISAPTVIPINTEPTLSAVTTVVQRAISAPGGITVDGDQSPLNPALVTARTIDLGKALYAKVDDIITTDILSEADADCQALIAIVDDLLGNLTRTLQRVSDAVVPFALHSNASIGNQKLAFDKYIPCVANVSASFALPPFHVKINFVVELLKHLFEQAQSVVRQAEQVVERFNTLLCIPRTLIAALRGGVCGIEQPKVVANRQCPSQLDLLLDRLQALIDTIDLLLRKILQALTSFAVDVELSIGSASRLAVDATIPCIGPVANFLVGIG